MAQQAAAPARMPFSLFTRLIPEFLGNWAITLGGPKVVIPLDNTGYADAIIVRLKGTTTVANAALVARSGSPWNALANILLQPPGLTPPYNCSGFMTHVWNLLERGRFSPRTVAADAPGWLFDTNAYDAAQQDVCDVFGSTGAGKVWSLWYVIPLSRSFMDQRGILPLGNKTRTQLTLTPAAIADLFTVAGNLTAQALTVDVFQAYYTAPPSGANADPDPYWSNVYEEQSQVIAAVGQQPVEIQPYDTITGIVHHVTLNDLPNMADVSTLNLRINKSDYVGPEFPMAGWAFIQRRILGVPLPLGVIAYDFDHPVDSSAYDVRSWIHSQDVNAVKSFLTIASGATLGSVANIRTSVRRLVDLHQGA